MPEILDVIGAGQEQHLIGPILDHRSARVAHDLLDAIFWQIIDEALNHSLTDRLGDVATPTLVIWGRHDRLIDVSCAAVMAAAIPDNRVVILEDVGHVPMIESPQQTAEHHLKLISET